MIVSMVLNNGRWGGILLKVQEIRELIKLVDASSINEFVYEQEGTKIEMKKASSVLPSSQAPAVQEVPAVETKKPEAVQKPVEVPAKPAEPAANQADKTASAGQEAELHKITSPMVGTFYQSSSPENDPYVRVGAKVSEDDVVCILEAMKLFNEITAEVKGEIVDILVEDGQLVEYGQPLFLVKAE